MIRFKLKTLLAFAVVAGIVAFVWTRTVSVWTQLPNSIWIEDGNLAIVARNFGVDSGFGDPQGFATFIYLPLWFIGLLLAAGAAFLVFKLTIVFRLFPSKTK